MRKKVLFLCFIFMFSFTTLSFATSDYLGSTFFGTDSKDSISFLKVAPNGDIYVAGVIGNLQLNNINGFDTDYNSTAEKLAFVARFDSNLTTLKNFTYIGDSYSYPFDFKISSDGDIYILTFPFNFDVENINGYNTTFSNSGSMLIRFDSSLNMKNYTYLKHIDNSDYVPNFSTFIFDSNNDIIIGGSIYDDAADGALHYKGILAKFSKDLTTFKGYNKYAENSSISKMVINNNAELIVTGSYNTPSSFTTNQTTFLTGEQLNNQSGIYISKFDSNLNITKTVLVTSGSGGDITFDNDDNIYMSIRTNSSYFVSDSSEKPVILKIDNNLSSIENFYTINFSIGDYVNNIKFKNDKLYVTGATFQTSGTNFPFTTGAWQPESFSHSVGMILVMNRDLSKLDYATVIGGSYGADTINGMDITNDNILFVGGYAQTANFPTSEGVYQETCAKGIGGSCYDAFIGKFNPSAVSQTTTTNLQVETNGTHVKMSWDNVADYTGYILYYAPYPYEGEQTIGSIDLGNVNSLEVNLPIGSAFYTAILPYNEIKEYGSFSNVKLINID